MLAKIINKPSSSQKASDTDPKKYLLNKNAVSFGMNIFSSKLNNSSLSDKITIKKGNNNANYAPPNDKRNSISNEYLFKSSLNKHKFIQNKSLPYNKAPKNILTLIHEELARSQFKKTPDSLNSSNSNNRNLNQKLYTISPRKNKDLLFKQLGESSDDLKESVILNMDNGENLDIKTKLDKMRASFFSQSLNSVNKNTRKKISQENLKKSDSNVYPENKNFINSNSENSQVARINSNSSINNSNNNLNYYSASNRVNKDDKNNMKRTSFLKESELNTINEECEIAVNTYKNVGNSKLIPGGYESEFLEEKKERNKSYVSSELNKFVDYPKDRENSNMTNTESKSNFNISKYNIPNKEQGGEYSNKSKNIQDHTNVNKSKIIAEFSESLNSSSSIHSSEDEDSISVRSIDQSSPKGTYTFDKRNKKDFNVKTAVGLQSYFNAKVENNVIGKMNMVFEEDKKENKIFSSEEDSNNRVNEFSDYYNNNDNNDNNNKNSANSNNKDLEVMNNIDENEYPISDKDDIKNIDSKSSINSKIFSNDKEICI